MTDYPIFAASGLLAEHHAGALPSLAQSAFHRDRDLSEVRT
jgi:hypothetical protein